MIIWLASYPKSGNTLVRSILTSLIFTDDGIVDFKKLHRISNFIAGPFFEKFTTDFNNISEMSKYWIKVQEKLNQNKKLKFFKTHNSFCTIKGNAFTNDKNTIGTIYIVRDPRDIIISASKYYKKTIEETKVNMFNKEMTLVNTYKNKPISTFLGSWSDHYNSWVKEKNKNILLIKYENLISKKEEEIKRIINFINRFAKLDVNEKKIKNCIDSSSFENMKKMENEGFFEEASKDIDGKSIPFFGHGKKGRWKNTLEKKIVEEIESKFQKEMQELGYLAIKKIS
jgi:hypothetical protein